MVPFWPAAHLAAIDVVTPFPVPRRGLEGVAVDRVEVIAHVRSLTGGRLVAALTTNVVPTAGLRFDNLLVAAAGGGDTAETGAGVFLVVKNASGSSITVTVATPETFDGDLALADRTVSVAATTGQSFIPLTARYRDPATGVAAITYSAVTTVTVGVFRVATS
jgi:hypothetical protein